jgi:hypothetical protein
LLSISLIFLRPQFNKSPSLFPWATFCGYVGRDVHTEKKILR